MTIGIKMKSIKALKQLRLRAERARQLYLFDVASFMLDKIKENAPAISIGNELKFAYADDLRLTLLDTDSEQDLVAIYLDGSKVRVSDKRAGDMVLYFQSQGSVSPAWVNVLAKYSPFPASMIPVKILNEPMRIISRAVRFDEIKVVAERIYKQRMELDKALREAGGTNVTVAIETDNGIGLETYADIGFDVLRAEFGLGRDSMHAHWRPAIKSTKKYAQGVAMNKVSVYMSEGNEKIFNIKHIDKIRKLSKESFAFAESLSAYITN